jgi:4-amino-4-deoxy-L-arabinose transferase-like glycosyltransferase
MTTQQRAESCVSPPPVTGSHRSRILLLAILLLAAFLRFYRLDAQSLWNDEGNSARLAERSLRLIVEGAAGDIHPPGYYLLLHYWRALFGQSEFALRSVSVVAGLAMILFTYLLGRRLFRETIGLIAAFIGAISPFAIYYAQEARMYALLAALSAASSYVAIRHLQSAFNRPPSATPNSPATICHGRSPVCLLQLAAYTLLTTAGLYIHYVYAFVLIAQNLVFALWWLVAGRNARPRWAMLVGWGGTQVAAFLLYLPWLPYALGAAGWSSPERPYRLGSALLDILRLLAVGITLPLERSRLALVVSGMLLLVGTWPAAGRRSVPSDLTSPAGRQWDDHRPGRRRSLLVASLVLLLVLPITLFFLLNLYKPAWLKFLVVALPPFHLLIAHGICNLSALLSQVLRSAGRASPRVQQAARALLLLALAAVTYPSLCNLYVDPAYARDDYRQLAADVRAMHQPGDAVVLSAPNQWEVFTYYHPDEDVYPAPYRPSPAKVDAFMTPILQNHERLFVLYWGHAESDPRRRIEAWLAQNAYKAGDRWYGDVRLATYGLAPLPGEGDVALDARFGEDIRLRGAGLPDRPFAPGDILPATLFWEAQHAIDQPYKITVQLLDGGGHLVAQVDTVPRDGLAPTTSWHPGEVMPDRYGIHLPRQLPPGRYTLIVAVYHAATGERLPVVVEGQSVDDHLPLSDVAVSPNH